MKKILFVSTFLFLSISWFSTLAADIFVSPSGNDSNEGTKKAPFKTVDRAKMVVAKIAKTNKNENFTIWLTGGIYKIKSPVVFNSNDFPFKNKILLKALPEETPVISGGIRLKKWKKNSAGIWVTELPAKENENWRPRELFINNRRATRARFPNKGYLRVEKTGADRRTNFFFKNDDFPVPENVNGVELVFLHDWSISRIDVKNINSKNNQLTAVDSIGAKKPAFFNIDNWEQHPRYFLENAIEFLDADYEWFLNSETKKVYLKLPENQNPETLQIVVPFSKGLIRLRGDESQPIKNIHFEGITFQYCGWQIPETGYCGVQACFFDSRPKQAGWAVVPAAVKANWAENCSFTNCTFENLGTSGLWFSTGCKNCSVTNSGFYDISGNGIMVGEGRNRMVNNDVWWKSAPGQVALENKIENCTVNECGKQFFGAVGIWCGLTAETTITKSEISNLPYTGISVGWMWSHEPTPCRKNCIDGNHIHHIMQILSDGGGIYMLGLQRGSKIVNNRISDVKINAGRAESNGMFLDEGTTDVVIANNLIYNIAKSPLRFHKATSNLVKKNYLFCTNGNPPIRYNSTKEADIRKVRNKVFADRDEKYFNY